MLAAEFSCLSSRTNEAWLSYRVGSHSCVLRYLTFSYSHFHMPFLPSSLKSQVPPVSLYLFPGRKQDAGYLAGKWCVLLTDLISMNVLIRLPSAILEGDKGCFLPAFLYSGTRPWVSVPLGHWFLRLVLKVQCLPSFVLNLAAIGWNFQNGLGERERKRTRTKVFLEMS